MSKGRFLVKEAMNARPVTVSLETTVLEAAKTMKKRDIGSCIVTDGKPIGLVTETDILQNLVAEDKKPSETTVAEIMTSPIIVIDPYVDIEEVMKTMGKLNIRRLPVVEDETLVGIISQKDVLKISPMLLELSREWCNIEKIDETHFKKQIFSGKCEDCGNLSANLKNIDGKLLCDDCIDQLKY